MFDPVTPLLLSYPKKIIRNSEKKMGTNMLANHCFKFQKIEQQKLGSWGTGKKLVVIHIRAPWRHYMCFCRIFSDVKIFLSLRSIPKKTRQLCIQCDIACLPNEFKKTGIYICRCHWLLYSCLCCEIRDDFSFLPCTFILFPYNMSTMITNYFTTQEEIKRKNNNGERVWEEFPSGTQLRTITPHDCWGDKMRMTDVNVTRTAPDWQQEFSSCGAIVPSPSCPRPPVLFWTPCTLGTLSRSPSMEQH